MKPLAIRFSRTATYPSWTVNDFRAWIVWDEQRLAQTACENAFRALTGTEHMKLSHTNQQTIWREFMHEGTASYEEVKLVAELNGLPLIEVL